MIIKGVKVLCFDNLSHVFIPGRLSLIFVAQVVTRNAEEAADLEGLAGMLRACIRKLSTNSVLCKHIIR